MKILIAGAGSIGKRHAANAAAMGHDVIICDTDPAKGISFDAGLAQKPGAVIIATPHVTHIELARKAIDSGAHVLIEKPIAITEDGIGDLIAAAEKSDRKIFVVCNMRFHPALRAIKDNIARVGNIHFARAEYGEYLPTMRPNVDYRTVYSAQKKLGGGIIFDVIHEIDYLSWLLGPIASVSCETAKRSNLEIDVEDYAALLMNHENDIRSELHLDYVRRHKERGLEIVGDKGTLVWRSAGKNPEHVSVKIYDADKNVWEVLYEATAPDANAAYIELLRRFLNAVQGVPDPELLTARSAWDELKIVLSAYNAASEGRRMQIRKHRNAS
jgi:predicted dehydrogenase